MGFRGYLEDIRGGAQLFLGLPHFLKHPMGLDEARATITKRRRNRGHDFLALAQKAIYGNPRSPYAKLLQVAGCEFGDFEQLVRQSGVEGTLSTLFRQGVYLTVDEFNGREPVVRGSTSFAVNGPAPFRNPLALSHLPLQTGGSRSSGRLVPMDLGFLATCAMNRFVNLHLRGGVRWKHALWGIPGGGAMGRLFDFALWGSPFERWFSPVALDDPRLDPRYRWSVHVIRWSSRLAGVTVPRPEYTSLDDVLPILRWAVATLEADETPHLWAYASAAVRISEAARKTGVSIAGLQFTATGEPLTDARLNSIRASGAEVVPTYATVQSGPIGYGCLAQNAVGDFHFFDDLHALIQPCGSGTTPGLPGNSFLLSSLRASTPMIFFNVSLGDQGILETRECRCPVEQLGWSTHLRSIRSYEKLTAGGMTFLDTDVIRVLEQVLPSLFGGAPNDYQLAEIEGDNGLPELKLIVHPAVGQLDENLLVERFIDSISDGGRAAGVMGLAWRGARMIRVERRPPMATTAGKILHLHFEPRRQDSS